MGIAILPDKIGSPATNLLVMRMPTESGPEILVDSNGQDPITHQPDTPLLRPGTYRLFLLTRGGGSVRLPLPGQPLGGQKLTAGNRVRWAFGEYAAPLSPVGYTSPSFEATLDFEGQQPGPVFAAAWTHAEQTAAFTGEICYYTGSASTSRALPACLAGDGDGGNMRLAPGIDKHDRLWHSGMYLAPPGKVGMRLTYFNAGTVRTGGAMLVYLPQA